MAATLSTVLLDETAQPRLRHVIGVLLARADRAYVAIDHVRLAHVDLAAGELRRVQCQLLLGRLDVDALEGLGRGSPPPRVAAIAEFLDSGRLDIRAGGLLRWKPDFSVFELPPPHEPVALVGAHYFVDPDVVHGPALTCVIRSAAAVARLRRRFQELWLRGRDVRDVVRAELASFTREPR